MANMEDRQTRMDLAHVFDELGSREPSPFGVQHEERDIGHEPTQLACGLTIIGLEYGVAAPSQEAGNILE